MCVIVWNSHNILSTEAQPLMLGLSSIMKANDCTSELMILASHVALLVLQQWEFPSPAPYETVLHSISASLERGVDCNYVK